MPSEMELQRLLEQRMERLLEYASQAKVAEALGVTRTAVWRWAHGQAVTPGAVQRVQNLLRPDLGETYEEAPPPDWAEGLAARVADSVVERVATLLGGPESPLSLLPELYDTLVGELPPVEPSPEGVEASPDTGGTARRQVRSRRAKA